MSLDILEIPWKNDIRSISYGLWDNNGVIAINLPLLLSYHVNFNMSNIDNLFYVKYSEYEVVRSMTFDYCAPNDIVFRDKTFNGPKRSEVYTLINEKS